MSMKTTISNHFVKPGCWESDFGTQSAFYFAARLLPLGVDTLRRSVKLILSEIGNELGREDSTREQLL